MLRATKVRIYPTPEQAEYLNAQFGAVRFAYNKALHIKKHAYQRHGVNLSPRNDLKPLLSVAKKSRRYAWLKEFDSMALQQAVINLDVAFSNFFNPKRKARFPTFKRKHGKQSSYHCVGVKVLDNAIKIPKLSPIEARLHRELHGKLKSITITRSATGKYYASILCDDGLEAPVKPTLISAWIWGLSTTSSGLTEQKLRIPAISSMPAVICDANKKRYPASKREARIVKRPESVWQRYTNGWLMPVLIFNTSSLVQLLTKTKR
ncbi:transposase in ISEc46 [Salmonella enterica subsp. enterica serovar Paratyphi A]|nr:transposase in ISEc46 [Salmonella enterica subsp. enterica serovar Paratyphi A]